MDTTRHSPSRQGGRRSATTWPTGIRSTSSSSPPTTTRSTGTPRRRKAPPQAGKERAYGPPGLAPAGTVPPGFASGVAVAEAEDAGLAGELVEAVPPGPGVATAGNAPW